MAIRHWIRLPTAAVLTFALAACVSDGPSREEASRQARSGPVREASRSTAAEIATALDSATRTASGLTPVARSAEDICHAGSGNGFSSHDDYRLLCRRDEARYFGADNLLDALREIDNGDGLTPIITDTLDDVVRYYARNGRADDGSLLPRPNLSYTVAQHGWTLAVAWSGPTDPRSNVPDYGLTWPIVFNDSEPVDLDALWNGPLASHGYLIVLSLSVAYHEAPWTD
ncbi:hypothetical protein [Virgisporangium aurantiacum]|uniref:Lipoprotein n=1 Tax=Virgisporangium aurantiacum TaxID=175570 RepID=A0A8J3ZNH1_9ACTN|nr:hypothetical protein [Virgisporangium aurantiacum]GIJ64898.1 hypothetical protein Vau01_124140 [Virgisporangium aurantiacum]